MALQSPKTYTFNHPFAAALMIPLVVLGVMLVGGLMREFNVMALVVLIFNIFLMATVVGFGFMRRIRFKGDLVEWKTLRLSREMKNSEVKHYGIVKYRAFRFIYLSRTQESPFNPDSPNVSPTPDTFVFQYRKSGWKTVQQWMEGIGQAKREDLHFRN